MTIPDLYFDGHYNYLFSIALMLTGLYITMQAGHLVKKLIGLSVFQTSVLLFYISLAWREGGMAPILTEGTSVYTNPLPHVLMLTAIVVGVAVLAVGLALCVRLYESCGTLEEDAVIARADAEGKGGDAGEGTGAPGAMKEEHGV